MNKPKINIDEIKPLKDSYLPPEGYFDSLADRIEVRKDEKIPLIRIEDINTIEESYQAPEGYFDGLMDKIEARKDEKMSLIRIEDINAIEESYQVPEGYFDGLMDKIEKRKGVEDNVVSFRRRKIRIWGSFVAAACIAMVVLSVVNFGPNTTTPPIVFGGSPKLNISDHEIVSLLNERDDEFELTDDEIIEVIENESVKSESTAIIDFLKEEGDIDAGGTEDDFLESI